MQVDNRVIDELARLAQGLVGTAAGLRDESEAQLRAGIERALGRFELVRRDELEAVHDMAARARTEQEAMAARIEALEERLSALERAADAAPGHRTTPADGETPAGSAAGADG